MTIENRRQLENARVKLKELEELYVQTQHRPVASEHVRELTLRSLRKRINQFKEEIRRRSAHPRTLDHWLGRDRGRDGPRLCSASTEARRRLTRPMKTNIRGLTAPARTARVEVRCRAPVARQAHNLEVGSSTLPTATGGLAPVRFTLRPGSKPAFFA